MKNRLNARAALTVLAIAVGGFSCGVLGNDEPEWDTPMPPQQGGVTGDLGNPQVDPYSTQPGSQGTTGTQPGSQGTASNPYGSFGTPSYGGSGSSGSGSGSSYYGPGSGSGYGSSGSGTGSDPNDPSGVYVYGGGSLGGDTGGSGGSTSGTNPGGGAASRETGYYDIRAEVSASLTGWFVCEFAEPTTAIPVGGLLLGLLTKLGKVLKTVRALSVVGAAVDDGFGCKTLYLQGTVGGQRIERTDVVAGGTTIVVKGLARSQFLGSRFELDLYDDDENHVANSLLGLGGQVPLGRCTGPTIGEDHITKGIELSCSYGGDHHDLKAQANTYVNKVQDSSNSPADDRLISESSDFLTGLRNLVPNTATIKLVFEGTGAP